MRLTRSRASMIHCCVWATGVLALSVASVASAQQADRGDTHADGLRILIETSKDGGLWWFPQGKKGFDPSMRHQGKALADSMKARSWEIVELARGVTITAQTLKGFDVVIRTPSLFAYTEAEAQAFIEYVEAGGTLILMVSSRKHSQDPIPEAFDLTVGPSVPAGDVSEWIDHPLGKDLKQLLGPWVPLTRLPEKALSIASLGPATHETVAALVPQGKGLVYYVGINLGPPTKHGRLLIETISMLFEKTPDQVYREVTTSSVRARARPSDLPPPVLLHPEAFAVLLQSRDTPWEFEWEDVPEAVSYQVVVLGPNAAIPLIDSRVNESGLIHQAPRGYIAEPNLRGWTWRVRARDRRGTWSNWSQARVFDVAPRAP